MKKTKRFLSMLLVVCMVFTMLPISVFAISGKEHVRTLEKSSNETEYSWETFDENNVIIGETIFDCFYRKATFNFNVDEAILKRIVKDSVIISITVNGSNRSDHTVNLNGTNIGNLPYTGFNKTKNKTYEVDGLNAGNNFVRIETPHTDAFGVSIMAVKVSFQLKPIYTVTFDKNNENATEPNPKTIKVIKGKTVQSSSSTLPTTSRTDGYKFVGWYTQDGIQFIATTPVNGNITVYAKWEKDESQFTNYTVEYYKDSFTDENKLLTTEPKEIRIGTTVTLTEEEKNLKQPTGYLSGKVSDTTITAENKTVKVLYVKDDSQVFNYTIEYYKDGEKFGTSVSGIVPKHTPIVNTVPDKTPDGYKLDTDNSTKLPFTVTQDNQIIEVRYVKDESQFTNYTVEYYKDSIIPENKIFTTEPKEIRIGTTVTLTEAEKSLKQPTGYLSGEVLDTTITAENKTVKVLYQKDNAAKQQYRVEYFINGNPVERLNYTDYVHKSNLEVTSVKGAEAGGNYAQDLANCVLDESHHRELPFTVTLGDDSKNIIHVYYKTTTSDIIKVSHEYYLNGVLQNSLTTQNNESAPADKAEFNTTSWHKIKGGYQFAGITIKGILKEMFNKPIPQAQAQIDELNKRLKTLNDELTVEKGKVENGAALLEDYNSLATELKALDEKLSDTTSSETSKPSDTTSSEASKPSDTTSSETSKPSDTTSSEASKPSNTTSSEVLKSLDTTSSEASKSEIKVDPRKEINARMAAIENKAPSMIAKQIEINKVKLELAEAEKQLTADKEEATLPKEITITDTTFNYDARYNYTATLRYSKTVSSGGNTSNDDTEDTPVDEPIDIPDEQVPQAKLPEDVVTIVDEDTPLGKLPKSGGMQAAGAGIAGTLALIFGMFSKYKKKED